MFFVMSLIIFQNFHGYLINRPDPNTSIKNLGPLRLDLDLSLRQGLHFTIYRMPGIVKHHRHFAVYHMNRRTAIAIEVEGIPLARRVFRIR